MERVDEGLRLHFPFNFIGFRLSIREPSEHSKETEMKLFKANRNMKAKIASCADKETFLKTSILKGTLLVQPPYRLFWFLRGEVSNSVQWGP